MEQAYLLLTGSEYCPDMDTLYGIYTDKDELKSGIASLRKWQDHIDAIGTQIMVYEFELNKFACVSEQNFDYPESQYEIYYDVQPDFARAKNWKWKSINELLER